MHDVICDVNYVHYSSAYFAIKFYEKTNLIDLKQAVCHLNAGQIAAELRFLKPQFQRLSIFDFGHIL